MSIDLSWDKLTTGPDGLELAETIRAFVHDKFQSVPLPRFIRAVNVHAFEFGSIPPEVELKDICDPLPDFYEESGDESGDDEESPDQNQSPFTSRDKRRADGLGSSTRPPLTNAPQYLNTPRIHGAGPRSSATDLGSPFLGGNTPGIPGGTSNLNYFHSHLATGLSGTQTPLAAVAGAHLPNGWPDYSSVPTSNSPGHYSASSSSVSRPSTAGSTHNQTLRERASVSTQVSSTTTRTHTQDGHTEEHATVEEGEEDDEPASPPRKFREPRVEDLQTVFRVSYSGDVKLSLTAEILLDYPMPSFVGIPLKLNITGLSFDGVAVLAYIRKRAHFCFLSPDDAHMALGQQNPGSQSGGDTLKMGGLLQEIKVESEIGQRENGKQVLKNVGKVEKFVLEQVRRIFEDEFVYPSFWTFLV